ncbi:MAG: response regulator transcription factor [Dehalococcoidia bacterium]
MTTTAYANSTNVSADAAGAGRRDVNGRRYLGLFVGEDNADTIALCADLSARGTDCVIRSYEQVKRDALDGDHPDIVIIDGEAIAGHTSDHSSIAGKIKRLLDSPVIILLQEDDLDWFDISAGFEDFVVRPFTSGELLSRIRHVIWRTSSVDNDNVIKQGVLIIDLNKYEVSVAGRVVNLSFKEYELLRVLVSNRNRVMTREALLDKVWGYDYFGGDRTVDVHIRRLRSKIEKGGYTFVETVRNVGYRFKGEG